LHLGQYGLLVNNGDPITWEPHHLGEIWGGAHWEVRHTFGRDNADKLVFAAWKGLNPPSTDLERPKRYVTQLIQTGASIGTPLNPQLVQQAFDRRSMK